jgi:hypothetical protein
MTGADVASLVEVIASPWALLIAVTVFGFLPVFTVRLFVLLYPAGHPRRAELVAELLKLRRLTRIFFAAEVVATTLVEGLGERHKAARALPVEYKSRRLAVRVGWALNIMMFAAMIALAVFSFVPLREAGLTFGEVVVPTSVIFGTESIVTAIVLGYGIRAVLSHQRRLAAYKREHNGGTG